jgi:4-hydroxybenzoate polyprenyltransferase/phosphoserine phosphatase
LNNTLRSALDEPENSAAQAVPGSTSPALAIDLDGTLIRTDLLHESTLKLLASRPGAVWSMLGWLMKGKAHFKREVAQRVNIDVAHLPFQQDVLSWVRAERSNGRTTVLCTASDGIYAQAIADHLGAFDIVMASDGQTNLSSTNKARALTERYGAGGFDYAGNSRADIPVWAQARQAIVVSAPTAVRNQAARVATVTREFQHPAKSLSSWMRALRLHQWVKNVLIFLPLLGSHEIFDPLLLAIASMAFVAFGFCASSVYLINDLIDLESDRRHPRKRFRPFASGQLTILKGLMASVVCLAAAAGVTLLMQRWSFAAWLAVYLGLTLCYTFWLKKKMLVDSFVLAGLYTLRVLAGAAATGLDTGFWLLALSLFLFFSLALVKRYSELKVLSQAGGTSVPGRDYLADDLQLVQTLGIASGFGAVMVVALYINGESVAQLYPHQQLVWLTVPVLLYWISRMWLKAHRGEMHHDPVVFALRDRVSQLTIAAFFAALLLAAIPW